jgi:hypothetical protein
MPNWCSNTLDIRAKTKEDLDDFLEKAKNENYEFSLESLYPIPEELKVGSHRYLQSYDPIEIEKTHRENAEKYKWNMSEEDLQKKIDEEIAIAEQYAENKKKYGAVSWYDWCVEKWGTKWDVEGYVSRGGDTDAHITFESAWSPPTYWLEHVAPQFPNLKFQLNYREEGVGFEGSTYAYRDEFNDECREMLSDYDPDFDEDNWDEE